jgi:hypothetical protein
MEQSITMRHWDLLVRYFVQDKRLRHRKVVDFINYMKADNVNDNEYIIQEAQDMIYENYDFDRFLNKNSNIHKSITNYYNIIFPSGNMYDPYNKIFAVSCWYDLAKIFSKNYCYERSGNKMLADFLSYVKGNYNNYGTPHFIQEIQNMSYGNYDFIGNLWKIDIYLTHDVCGPKICKIFIDYHKIIFPFGRTSNE